MKRTITPRERRDVGGKSFDLLFVIPPLNWLRLRYNEKRRYDCAEAATSWAVGDLIFGVMTGMTTGPVTHYLIEFSMAHKRFTYRLREKFALLR